MLVIDITLADIRVRGEYSSDGLWKLLFLDNLTGTMCSADWSPEDLGIVVKVMLSGDDSDSPDAVRARQLVEDFPVECRPVP